MYKTVQRTLSHRGNVFQRSGKLGNEPNVLPSLDNRAHLQFTGNILSHRLCMHLLLKKNNYIVNKDVHTLIFVLYCSIYS